MLQELLQKYSAQNKIVSLREQLKEKKRFLLKGLNGSSRALVTASVLNELGSFNIIVLDDKEEAAYFYNDLVHCNGNEKNLFFPSSYKRSVQFNQPDNGNIILRTNTIDKIKDALASNANVTLVTHPEALVEKVVSHKGLADNTLKLSKGEKISIEFISEVLAEYGFEYTDFVYEPGQYSIRGGIVDVFSFAYDHPFRIDFFGDEVETIRSFDVETQLSIKHFESISLMPNLDSSNFNEDRVSILSFINKPCTIWQSDTVFISDKISQIFENTLTEDDAPKQNALLMGSEWQEEISKHTLIEFGNKAFYPHTEVIEFNTKPQPLFKKNFNLLGDNLKMHIAQDYTTLILSDSKKQLARLKAIFNDTHQGIDFIGSGPALHSGFIDEDLKICCYTDHQIFDRFHKYQISSYFSNKATISLKELKNLHPGDYVVHVDHGIGRFGGLEKTNINGKVQEVVKLVYKDNDTILVPLPSLHRISKYKGKDDSEPKMHKLGSGAWQKLKTNTKKKVKDIAKDLIALYAKRKEQTGFAYTPDTYLKEELEASFIYEDTPDQLKATNAVKEDMQKSEPMDRLVCGDVGFGKTEVAIRAAFKAVTDSKQVAVLVPTTILAFQHYNTFKERLKDLPCKVEYVSRLKKPAEQRKTLAKLVSGEVDIIIGTHRLLGKDIKFKDLGLFIIDEEQKFGVSAKEKLKAIKVNVDTLTLTATPIPRTLQFSLLGARDLSIISTPPPNRHPIITELHTFNKDIIADGINYEVSRGGQVFFINNRIQNIYEIEALIKEVCPHVKTIVGHGQMDGPKLEKVMFDFMNGDYDVLIATTIIESGLDIPNANTIFINNAQNFGLSDLHQLRGRVGRSNKRAFCYLLAPPPTVITPEARRRLKAIEEFSDLGSGIHIAMQDLDIRGAGNLLGAEQSGFIADIGYETYNRILDEALLELKENEFKDFFKEEKKDTEEEEPKIFVNDCIIDTDEEMHLPDNYVSSISERIRLYRQLDNIKEADKLDTFKEELIDRFGKLPKPAEKLFEVVKLRWLAIEAGFEKLILKNKKLIITFVSNQESSYYQSKIFMNILGFVQSNPARFRMKEHPNKLTMVIEDIPAVEAAEEIIAQMLEK